MNCSKFTAGGSLLVLRFAGLSWQMAGERGKFGGQSDIRQRGKSFIRHQKNKIR